MEVFVTFDQELDSNEWNVQMYVRIYGQWLKNVRKMTENDRKMDENGPKMTRSKKKTIL